MPKHLTSEQQLFIVTRLATFESPAEVRDACKSEYGLEITLQSLASYDPTTVTGARDLSRKLKAVFDETRAKFLQDVEAIPIANSAYRLRQLNAMSRAAMEKKNYPLVATLLEQAAKEVGGMYTNVRKVAGHDGGPIEHLFTPDERIDQTVELLTVARKRMANGAPKTN